MREFCEHERHNFGLEGIMPEIDRDATISIRSDRRYILNLILSLIFVELNNIMYTIMYSIPPLPLIQS